MKKLNLNFIKVFTILLGVSLLTLTSCNPDNKKSDNDSKQEISILYPNWAEGIAFTNLAKVALDNQGYNTKITPLEPGIIYATLAKGDADLFFDAWLPNTHSSYMKKFGDKLTKLGESFSNGTTGLVVPSYCDIESIEQLNDNVDKFDGKIIGIGSGAGIHGNTEKCITEYELNYKQVTSSGAAMVASLKKAIDAQEPVIITGWKPHFMFSQYDIKYLKDPKNIYPKDKCTILSRTNFKNEQPDVAKFCANFNLEEDKLYDLMEKISNAENPLEGAKAFYKENKADVDAWFPKK
ncbi:MAG: glycine betaine ABC transporter substrate-binding protein [Bacteroidales bacterium]|jgi:glycine betaine/proline transport system substrate-binding protein|nr:glycine betaine ABC transporter substrate-binding protein [Bacteroidales bacterium]